VRICYRNDKTDDGYKEVVEYTREQLKEFNMRFNCVLSCQYTPMDAAVYSDLDNMCLVCI